MKILVAGATGAIGRPLMRGLITAGHEVLGMSRSKSNSDMLIALGAQPVIADALKQDQVMTAVQAVRPDVIIHELTALSQLDTRHMERDFAMTNRLRIEGTDNLVAAAKASGVSRVIAQSHIVPYARTGSGLKNEDDAFDAEPVAAMRPNQQAMEHLEAAVLSESGFTGIVLRYGWFYGPHTQLEPGGGMLETIRRRRVPLIGDGGGVWSFVHVADAADATVAAVERGAAGVYNVVDDDPAPVSEWLPTIAGQIGAKPPRRMPRFLARLFAGEATVVMMTELRGASNRKAKSDLGWQPAHPSWRESIAG